MSLIKSIHDAWTNEEYAYKGKRNVFRASKIAYCERRQFFDKTVPTHAEPVNVKTQGIFAMGNAVHQFIQEILPSNIVLSMERKVSMEKDGVILTGHFDLLLSLEDYGITVMDIKTTNKGSFYYRKNDGISHHHFIQANVYAGLLGAAHFGVLYVNKEDFDMLEFIEPFHKSSFEEAFSAARRVFESVQANVMSPFTGEEWECRYCPYGKVCPKVNPEFPIKELLEKGEETLEN